MTDSYVISSVRETDTSVTIEVVTPTGEVKRMRLTVKIWEALGLSRADVITRETYERIAEYSEMCEAVTKTLRILSDGMYSIRALSDKLGRLGFSREAAEAATALALKKGLINEKAQAEAIAERQVTKLHRGRARVIRELTAKGYPAGIAREAADSVPIAAYEEALEISMMKKCRTVIPKDKKERDKLTASLVRLGFSPGEILKKMNENE